MATTGRSGATAERFVEVTLDLIEERGGPQDVNLREVARRVGCAHTNVYNHFDGFTGLLWEALRRTVAVWAAELQRGLDDSMAVGEYLRHLIENFVRFPQEHPGLYRFISLDPIGDGHPPADVLATVRRFTDWYVDVVMVCAPGTSRAEAENAALVVDAYLSGESASLLTGRVLPGHDLGQRMLDNSLRLFAALTEFDESTATTPASYPQLDLEQEAT